MVEIASRIAASSTRPPFFMCQHIKYITSTSKSGASQPVLAVIGRVYYLTKPAGEPVIDPVQRKISEVYGSAFTVCPQMTPLL